MRRDLKSICREIEACGLIGCSEALLHLARHVAHLDRLPLLGGLLDLCHERPIPPGCDGRHAAGAAAPGRAAHAVQIVRHVQREVVHDHMVHLNESLHFLEISKRKSKENKGNQRNS